MHSRTSILALTGCFLLSACSQYFPVQDEAPLPVTGEEVKAQLESPTSLDVGSITIHDATTIEGHVYRSYGDTLAMFSRVVRTAYGVEHLTHGAVFYFRRDQFRQLEERRLVPLKTAIASGVTVAGLLVAYQVAIRAAGGNEPEGPRGGDRTHIIAPLPVRIVIRR